MIQELVDMIVVEFLKVLFDFPNSISFASNVI